jgi:hypothetical protein
VYAIKFGLLNKNTPFSEHSVSGFVLCIFSKEFSDFVYCLQSPVALNPQLRDHRSLLGFVQIGKSELGYRLIKILETAHQNKQRHQRLLAPFVHV